MSETVDAVVVGAGPNGLVAANLLADAGWDVVVLEANDAPGGAVRTAEVTAPGFHNDLFSAFYPFTAASPVMRDLALEDHGLRWTEAPLVLATILQAFTLTTPLTSIPLVAAVTLRPGAALPIRLESR